MNNVIHLKGVPPGAFAFLGVCTLGFVVVVHGKAFASGDQTTEDYRYSAVCL